MIDYTLETTVGSNTWVCPVIVSVTRIDICRHKYLQDAQRLNQFVEHCRDVSQPLTFHE